MLKKIQYALLVLTLPLLLSCNGEGSQEVTESETAFTEYQDLVTQFEEDTLTEIERRAMTDPNFDSATWATLTADKEQEFEQKRQVLEQNLDQYPPERQQEIRDLDDRYNLAMENREAQYEEVSHRYKLRQELLGLENEKDDMSDIAPADMAATYNQFVENVAKGAESYETRDWNLIEGWWSSLSSRYRSMEAELNQEARREIAQAQEKYTQIRKQYAPVE